MVLDKISIVEVMYFTKKHMYFTNLVSTKCGYNFTWKKFNLHSKMGRIVVFRGNVDTK